MAMGERQRYADQGEKDARDHMRQEPHRRRERQKRRNKAKVGEVPGQVVAGHSDQRQAADAVDGVDAARALARGALRGFAAVHGVAASSNASSRTNTPSYSTGPVISTWSSAGRHSMISSPPGSRTVALRSISPRRDAATTVAQAAEPRASVSPTPRSHTRALTSSRAMTWAKVTLAFSGNIGWTSILAPSSAASMRFRSATKNTACGLPMLTTEA